MYLFNVVVEAIKESDFELSGFHSVCNEDKPYVFVKKGGLEFIFDVSGLEELQNCGVDAVKDLVKDRLGNLCHVG